MSPFIRIYLVSLIISLASISGFSQEPTPKKDTVQPVKEQTPPDETKDASSRTEGLRKITTRSPHGWDIDINIDEEALDANIELAIENAMESVEVALENLEIHIEPIEINLEELDLDFDPIEIEIPNLDIDVDPVEIDLNDIDIDIDIDEDDFNWNDDEQEETFRDELSLPSDQDINKNQEKNNSKKDEAEKSKGLKEVD